MTPRSSALVAVTWAITPVESIAVGDQIHLGGPRTVLAKHWGGPIGVDAWRFLVDGVVPPVWVRPGRALPVCPARDAAPAPWLDAVIASQAEVPDVRVTTRALVLVRARNRLPLRRLRAALRGERDP